MNATEAGETLEEMLQQYQHTAVYLQREFVSLKAKGKLRVHDVLQRKQRDELKALLERVRRAIREAEALAIAVDAVGSFKGIEQ